MREPKARVSALQFQNRDYALLRDLFESRVMTSAHVAALHFDDKKEAAKKRLQKLKAAGLIAERRRRAYEPSVLYLTRKAFSVLRDQGTLLKYPLINQRALEKRARVSDITLRHELEVMDVKAAFHAAISKIEIYSVEEFCTWPLLNQFETMRVGRDGVQSIVKPDGFIRIREKEDDGGLSEHCFFLELDRSSETLDTIVVRAGCYLDYYRSGGFAEKHGASRNSYREYPFRVLMVFKTAERRNNTAERLLQTNPPVLTQACLSTFEEVTTKPLGPIWICPADYRDAMRGTPFDSDKVRNAAGYKRQSSRDEFVERNVKKFCILGV